MLLSLCECKYKDQEKKAAKATKANAEARAEEWEDDQSAAPVNWEALDGKTPYCHICDKTFGTFLAAKKHFRNCHDVDKSAWAKSGINAKIQVETGKGKQMHPLEKEYVGLAELDKEGACVCHSLCC